MEWLIKLTTPEGVDPSPTSKKITLSIRPPKKEGYDVNVCFQSLEGVKLFQPVQLSIDLESLKFEAQELQVEAGQQKLLFNLCEIIKQETENIRELVDFEEGLSFAQHRLLDLITIKYTYLHNPFYNS